MKDNFLLSNNSFDENIEEEDNNSLFQIKNNNFFQNQDSNTNYFNNIKELESNQEEEQINNNEYYQNDFENNNFDNSLQSNNYIFPENENENNLNKDFSLISPIPGNEDDSYKMLNKSNFNSNDMIKEEIMCKDVNSSGTDCSPLSTGGTGGKSQSKDNSVNNVNNNSFNNKFISFNNEKKKNNKKTNNNIILPQNGDKTVLSKKRKTRIHLEDLNIDPEIIKYKKYQTIGDKVITSKNSVITDMDKKEIRAIRNRISAQKSRDRKKAEFLNLQLKLKYLQEQIDKQNLIIQNFEKISCSVCKSKLNEINKVIIENSNYKIILDQSEIQNEKDYLVLDENSSILSDKKNSIIGKLSGALIALVCLIGIILCVIEGGFTNNFNENQINLRHLSSDNVYENKRLNSLKFENNITNENINTNMPLIIKSNLINTNFENNMNKLQLYHDKFGLDIYSYLKKNKREKIDNTKNGFLTKKLFYNDSTKDNSLCIETKSIEHNNYIIDNNFKNTLPVEANNIVLDNNYNKLSHRIISLLLKDYDTLQRFINGKSLSLQEQIEIEAKNSEDGCVYLQMIIPKVINYENNNETYTRYGNDFFEIRCKIFAYNNYYDNKVAPAY